MSGVNPISKVVVIDSKNGDQLANNATGTIETNSFFTQVIVPITTAPQPGRTYLVSGYEGVSPNGKFVDFPKMYYEGGGLQQAKFVDNPQ